MGHFTKLVYTTIAMNKFPISECWKQPFNTILGEGGKKKKVLISLVSLISNIHFSTSSFNNIKQKSKEMLKDVSGILNEFLNMVSVQLKHLIDNTSLQENTSYYK